jgi:hypothetical protein
MSQSKLKAAIKSYKYLTPLLVIGGLLLYSIIGWIIIENYFDVSPTLLYKFFGAICLIVNLYVLSKIFNDDGWEDTFAVTLIAFSLIYCSIMLNNEYREYAFIGLSLYTIFYTIAKLEKLNIENTLQFLSIMLTYFFLVSSYYTFGKQFLSKWLSIIDSLVDIRFVLLMLILTLVLGEGIVLAVEADKPKIPLISYVHYTPSKITIPFIGIIEGFKKSGVWIRNNTVYFINIVWFIIAFIGYYIYQTLINTKGRILGFIQHSDKIISTSLTFLGCLLFTDYSIKLSNLELNYLWTSDMNILIDTTLLFLCIVSFAVLIKIAFHFEYRKIDFDYVSVLIKETFSGMIQAPLTVAAYYCGAGWMLCATSFLINKFGFKDWLPHFHSLGIYTYMATLILSIIIIIVSFTSPKNVEENETIEVENKSENK